MNDTLALAIGLLVAGQVSAGTARIGNFSVTGRATDGAGGSGSVTFTIRVLQECTTC